MAQGNNFDGFREEAVKNSKAFRVWAKETGYKVRRFQTRELDINCNRILLALLYCNDIKLSELEEYMWVDNKTVRNWCYRSAVPLYQSHIDKLCDLLDTPFEILFNREYNAEIDPPRLQLTDVNRTYFRKNINPKKKILYGMMKLYKMTTHELAEIMNLNLDNVGRWIFQNKNPNLDNALKLQGIFQVPYPILLRVYDTNNSAREKLKKCDLLQNR